MAAGPRDRAFLDAVRPCWRWSRLVLEPVGHPAPATLARLAQRGVRLFRTDRDGSVEVTLDGLGRLEVRPDRRSARSGQPPATEPLVATAPRAGPLVAFSCGGPAAPG